MLLMSGTDQGEKVDSKSQLLSAKLSLRSKVKDPWNRVVFCLPTLVMASPGMGAWWEFWLGGAGNKAGS